jgi:oligopeptide/dipeptide ABC transporter ATP-binding protein
VLTVEGLTVELPTEQGPAMVVEGVDFKLEQGRTLGLVGESGSGKTVTALAVMGLMRSPLAKVTGIVRYGDRNLLELDAAALREVQGRHLAMIFQEPRRSLDPAFTVGEQIAEVARRHLKLSRRAARARAVEMLDIVGISQPAKRSREYPHTFSGGMCQRVMLAVALAAEPQVLIADEPTTALDVTVQALVLELLRDLGARMGLAILFITHDLAVVAEMCDAVGVMYAGQVVEYAPVRELFRQPRHPYTEGLLNSLPQLQDRTGALGAIPGAVPPPYSWPTGCRFHPRCQYAVEACAVTKPALEVAGSGGSARCIRVGEITLKGLR